MDPGVSLANLGEELPSNVWTRLERPVRGTIRIEHRLDGQVLRRITEGA